MEISSSLLQLNRIMIFILAAPRDPASFTPSSPGPSSYQVTRHPIICNSSPLHSGSWVQGPAVHQSTHCTASMLMSNNCIHYKCIVYASATNENTYFLLCYTSQPIRIYRWYTFTFSYYTFIKILPLIKYSCVCLEGIQMTVNNR